MRDRSPAGGPDRSKKPRPPEGPVDPVGIPAHSSVDVAGVDGQVFGVEVAQRLDVAILDQVVVEMLKVGGHLQLVGSDNRACAGIQARIGVDLQVVLEQPAERLEDAAGQVVIVPFLEDLAQGRHPHGEADRFCGVVLEEVGQPVELAVVGDQDRPAQGTEDVDAVEEVALVDGVVLEQVVQGHLGDDQDLLSLVARLLLESALSAVEHVHRDIGHGPETAAEEEDRAFVQGFRRLNDFSARGEHRRSGEAALDELQAHQAVVHVGERRAREFDHIDFEGAGRTAPPEVAGPWPSVRARRARSGSDSLPQSRWPLAVTRPHGRAN